MPCLIFTLCPLPPLLHPRLIRYQLTPDKVILKTLKPHCLSKQTQSRMQMSWKVSWIEVFEHTSPGEQANIG
ncbi:hypothetical protein HOLleu_06642 [Holothuria leucospilota]|uniref:Uncharacterized protein n=1 Tax=Holothuria leucospilota TaxID=206669 RepID=A0A9Q1CME8_HOLLE|nr:hypothetical protein HOLleu_06642 [Holothuria leucospilota]